MKIVIDCRFWGPKHTGLGRYTQSLVKAIYQLKPNHQFYLIINPKNKKTIQKTVPEFNLIVCSAKPYSIKEQFQLPKILSQLKSNLVHFPHFNVPLFFKGKFIVTIHDLIKHHSTGSATTTKPLFEYPFKRFGYRLIMKHAVNNSHLILVPSQWVKKDIIQLYNISSKKIIVTPEAAAEIYNKPQNFKTSVSQLKTPYLIFVGNTYPHKNILQLIKAVQIVNQQKKLKLIIVTARDIFYQRLRQQIRKLKAQSVIKLKGFASDQELKSLYYHSLAFITPSLLEGFGLPGIEAMASGTVVLSSNTSALPEVYAKSTLYFNPNSLNDMVKKINKVIDFSSSDRQKLINKGQKHAQKYSWQNTAEKTLNAYQQ